MYREFLLANYLRDNPVWQDLIKIYESTQGNALDQQAIQLSEIRDMNRLTDSGATTNDQGGMLDPVDHELFDRATMVRICTMLGFGYPNINDQLFSTEDYLRIARNIGDYYKDQGTDSFIKFYGYCLNVKFDLQPTWTNDYKNFFAEEDTTVGLPVWKGGTWYPTSHVNLTYDAEHSPGLGRNDLRDFFNYLAPLNLVLLHVVEAYYVAINLNMAVHGSMTILPARLLERDTNLVASIAGSMKVIDHKSTLQTTDLNLAVHGGVRVSYVEHVSAATVQTEINKTYPALQDAVNAYLQSQQAQT